jgi:hypothetical protein
MSLTGPQSSRPAERSMGGLPPSSGASIRVQLGVPEELFAAAVVVGAHHCPKTAFRTIGLSPLDAARAAGWLAAGREFVTVAARIVLSPVREAPSGVVVIADPAGAELAGVAELFKGRSAPFALLVVLASQASPDESRIEDIVLTNQRLTGQHWACVQVPRIRGPHPRSTSHPAGE